MMVNNCIITGNGVNVICYIYCYFQYYVHNFNLDVPIDANAYIKHHNSKTK